jgi:large subunit ribosomal protein L3
VAKSEKTEQKVDPGVFVRRKLLGRKLGMTQIFDENGICVSVTAVETGPCTVVQVKTADRDGYDAVQIGFVQKTKNVTKPLRGHFEKAGVESLRHLSEVKLKVADHGLKPGLELTVDLFDGVGKVDVSAVSKGKGFAGTIKRWHFKQGPVSHGSMNIRDPGSIGQSASPSRVFKGIHMSGHMGAKRVTSRNLRLVKIDRDSNLLLIEGAVPGPRGGLVQVSASFMEKEKDSEKA